MPLRLTDGSEIGRTPSAMPIDGIFSSNESPAVRPSPSVGQSTVRIPALEKEIFPTNEEKEKVLKENVPLSEEGSEKSISIVIEIRNKTTPQHDLGNAFGIAGALHSPIIVLEAKRPTQVDNNAFSKEHL